MVIQYLKVPIILLMINLAVSSYGAQQTNKPVLLGVSPWTSPQLLHAWIEPMRARLEQQSGQKIIISSSSDLETYLIDNIEKKFMVSQMPLHMSLYLIKYHQFKPILMGRTKPLRTYILTPENSGIESLQDLHSEPYQLPDPIAIVSFMTLEALSDKPLNTFKYSKNHWSVLNYLMEGKLKAGSVLSPMYEGLNDAVKKRFKVLYRSPFDFEGMYIVPPNANTKDVDRVVKALNGFKPATNSIIRLIEPLEEGELDQWFQLMGKYADKIHDYMRTKYPDSPHLNPQAAG